MSFNRITTNVLATYTQTFIGIVVGLFCSRWVYLALGEVKFGLFALVGALIGFVGFINSLMVGSTARFFAVALGEQRRVNNSEQNNILNQWFNVALSVQCVMPAILITVGYPIGIYFIRNVLTIPTEHLQACVWVFRFSLLTAFFSMVNVPFNAIYTAKQLIFIRNLFGVLQTFVWAAEGWWLLHYDGNRLVAHAIAMMILTSTLYLSMAGLALATFSECKIKLKYWFDAQKLKELFSYASFTLFGSLGNLFATSGVAMVVNAFFGPAMNAAIGIGTQISQKTAILSQALTLAIQPEIATRIGAKEAQRANSLGIRASFYAVSLYMLVLLPIIFYMHDILKLWLKIPPTYAYYFANIMLVEAVILQLTCGYMILIHATGRIKAYQTTLGALHMSTILLVWILLKSEVNVVASLAIGWILPKMLITSGRVLFAKKLLAIEMKQVFLGVLLPVAAIFIASLVVCSMTRLTIANRLLGFFTTLTLNCATVGSLFCLLLNSGERENLYKALNKLKQKTVRSY